MTYKENFDTNDNDLKNNNTRNFRENSEEFVPVDSDQLLLIDNALEVFKQNGNGEELMNRVDEINEQFNK